MNIISFSGINDLNVQIDKLRNCLLDFAEAKNIETNIISS